MKRLSIRWRLTLWYGFVLAVVLVVFGAAVYATRRHELLKRVDEALASELDEISEDVQAATDSNRLARLLERRFARHEAYEFQVSRVGGEMFFQSNRLKPERLPIAATAGSLKHLDFETMELGMGHADLETLGRMRTMGRLVPGPDGSFVVQAATPLAAVDRELTDLLMVFPLAGPLVLACALGGGYVLARQALRPVDRMVQAADQITAMRLDRRIEVANPDDELGRLARTLNGMIARLERSFEEIRRFTADAAHELRTPITVLRTEAEVALRSPRDAEHYRGVIEDQLEELERLSRLADRLLFLCREDARSTLAARRPVDLRRVVEDVVEHMRIAADEKNVTLTVTPAAPLMVEGDEEPLRRLLFNLVDNAIKFTGPGGSVAIAARSCDSLARIEIADTGIGIPPEHVPHVFQRFYRVDPSAGPDSGGSGLGLAIARSIAETHGGAIAIESVAGAGTRVILTLPGKA